MKLKHATTVLLAVLLISGTAFAQNSKQELNDQFWEAVRKGDLAISGGLVIIRGVNHLYAFGEAPMKASAGVR